MPSSKPSTARLASWLTRSDARIEIDRERCRRSLAHFISRAWHVLEPERAYQHGWHIDAICAHLEAISRGELTRLAINVPPGCMKSMTVSVFWQAWEWGPLGRSDLRFLSTAFTNGPVVRDTRKTRDLILSEWFQARWPVKLARVGELSFASEQTGTREGVPFGSLTSQRGDRLLIDDPHSVDTAESDAERAATTRRFREGAQNRLNDIKRSAIVVIMQRLHEADVCGVIDEIGMGYERLVLPMEFEADRVCNTRWFRDRRTSEGELLFPELFPREQIDALKASVGEYAWAGQYQQRPAPRQGGMFKCERIEIVDVIPECDMLVRAWDLASTEGAGAFTAGALLGRRRDGKGYVLADMVRVQFSPGKVRDLLRSVALLDGKRVRIRLPQDPGQAGKAQAMEFAALLDGFTLSIVAPTGEKDKRAEPFAVQVEGQRVSMLRAPWNDALLGEMRMFPAGRYKDQVDALSDAYSELLAAPRATLLHHPLEPETREPRFHGIG